MPLIIGTQLCPVDLYEDSFSYSPRVITAPRGHMLYIDPYRENPLKSSCLKPTPLIFGTQLFLRDLCQDCSSYSPGAKNGLP